MHSDTLGLLYQLLHVETLLLSSISREDGELVELDADLEGQPRLWAKALVWLTPTQEFLECISWTILSHCICTSPMTKQRTSLKAFRVSAPASLQAVFRSSFIAKSFFVRLSFIAFISSSLGALRSGSNCFLTSEMAPNTFPTSWIVPFCSRRRLTAMTRTRHSLLLS
jgi:hypothetical protein